jgi:REP element-mobilizing transposase RayT
MSEPLGYLLTWPTYGTWLHGDARSSVDREHNQYDTPRLPPHEGRSSWEQNHMRAKALRLDDVGRQIVDVAIKDHCRYRGWELFALAVRTNHVHVVVGHAGLRPEAMVSQFKAWATRRLREAGCVGADTPVWVRHGSMGYLWNEGDVRDAVTYLEEGQDIEK